MDVMVGRVVDYFGLRQKELEKLRGLKDDDIVHFKHIAVDKEHFEEIRRRVDKVIFSQTAAGMKAKLDIEKRYQQGEFDFGEAARLMEDAGLTGRQIYSEDLALEYIANHYYLPVIYSQGKKLDYIRHIIDEESEVRFLRIIRDYAPKAESVLRQLDWWNFSKLDQYLDTPCIPYYDPKQNRIARFIPDFVFWGRKGNRYTILFVDPKGLQNIDWERKVDGFQRHFEDAGKPKVFQQGDMEVSSWYEPTRPMPRHNRGIPPAGSLLGCIEPSPILFVALPTRGSSSIISLVFDSGQKAGSQAF
jgi:hypothetical protein